MPVTNYDPNTEAFQMRAQWQKADNCRKMWFDRWSWLLDERQKLMEQSDVIRQEAAAVARSQVTIKTEVTKSLKPVPVTSTGFIGWLGNKRDCLLEVYEPWLCNPKLHLPEIWDDPEYMGVSKK